MRPLIRQQPPCWRVHETTRGSLVANRDLQALMRRRQTGFVCQLEKTSQRKRAVTLLRSQMEICSTKETCLPSMRTARAHVSRRVKGHDAVLLQRRPSTAASGSSLVPGAPSLVCTPRRFLREAIRCPRFLSRILLFYKKMNHIDGISEVTQPLSASRNPIDPLLKSHVGL